MTLLPWPDLHTATLSIFIFPQEFKCAVRKSALPVQTGNILFLAFEGFGARRLSRFCFCVKLPALGLLVFLFREMVPQLAELCCLHHLCCGRELVSRPCKRLTTPTEARIIGYRFEPARVLNPDASLKSGMINPLKPSGNYMSSLLQQSIPLHLIVICFV